MSKKKDVVDKKKLKKFKDVKDKLKKITIRKGMIGADPELFVKRSGRVIGSEKVITETEHVVEDGVQVELHPSAHTCRESFGSQIRNCLFYLQEMLYGQKCSVSSDVLVDVSKRQYDSLKDKNKQFGCGRSHNAHTNVVEVLDLDPSKYLKRSAGGHMHFGTGNIGVAGTKVLRDPKKIVPLMDIIVGNTAVLLDRDPGNAERRKYYGLAGEYRTPPHGLEYRTLSNFWLRGEPLMSLMFGLARTAIGVAEFKLDKHLLSLVDMEDIIKAINTNDYVLAKKNWDKYKEFIVAVSHSSSSLCPIRTMADVKFFERVADEGIDKWFSDDIMENWLGTDSNNIRGGWRTFKYTVEHRERRSEQQALRERRNAINRIANATAVDPTSTNNAVANTGCDF